MTQPPSHASQSTPGPKTEPAGTAVRSEPSSSGYGGDFDMDDAFEDMERIVFPSSKRTSTPNPVPSSRAHGPVALPRDWVDRQVPLKLTTLHAIPSLPYAQNWTCNVLAIVVSLSPVEASYLPPYTGDFRADSAASRMPAQLAKAWVYKPVPLDNRIHVILVVKYQQGKPVQRYETTVANPSRTADAASHPYSDGILRFSLRCQKMNSHGLFMLGVAHTCLHRHEAKSTVAVSGRRLVCFNVLTEAFFHRNYERCLTSPKFHRPTWDWAEWRSIQAWDDYLLVLWQPQPHVIHEPCTFTELLQAADNVACLAGDQEVFGDPMRPGRLEPALTVDVFHKRRSGIAHRVFMDDDFVVYAAPDSMLVSTFRGARGVTMPPPLDDNLLAARDRPAVSRQIAPLQPLQSWDGDVYTTLEAPQLD